MRTLFPEIHSSRCINRIVFLFTPRSISSRWNQLLEFFTFSSRETLESDQGKKFSKKCGKCGIHLSLDKNIFCIWTMAKGGGASLNEFMSFKDHTLDTFPRIQVNKERYSARCWEQNLTVFGQQRRCVGKLQHSYIVLSKSHALNLVIKTTSWTY
jgi:hypothetical protein